MAPRPLFTPREATDIELAYVAGFFDGEGCVYLNALKNGGASLRVKISQKDKRPLEYIRSIFGGSVCVSRNKKWATECWNWSVSAAQGERFLKLVQPFCLVKKEAIEIGLEYCSIKRPVSRPGIGHRWNPFSDEEKAQRLDLRRRLHAVNSWRDRPLKEA